MSDRMRAVLLGVGLGVAPLLLLDLASTLQEAVTRDPAGTSVWWPAACYLAVGAIVAVGVLSGRRDRIVPVVGLAVVLLVVLPTVPSNAVAWLRNLVPWLEPGFDAPFAVGLAIAGAYAYAAVRGPRA